MPLASETHGGEDVAVFAWGPYAHAFHSPYWWLKCAYGIDNTEAAPVKRYHDFLCYLIEHNPRWASRAERALNPVLGKSLVVYGEKVPTPMAKWGKRSLD